MIWLLVCASVSGAVLVVGVFTHYWRTHQFGRAEFAFLSIGAILLIAPIANVLYIRWGEEEIRIERIEKLEGKVTRLEASQMRFARVVDEIMAIEFELVQSEEQRAQLRHLRTRLQDLILRPGLEERLRELGSQATAAEPPPVEEEAAEPLDSGDESEEQQPENDGAD